MDRVARIGVIWHRRSGHLERPGRQGVNIGNARIRTHRIRQTRAAGAEQELIFRGQAGVAAGEAEDAGSGWILNTRKIGGRQHIIESLLLLIGADEIFAVVRRRDNLELMCLRKISARRAVGVDNSLRQQVMDLFFLVLRNVGGEEMIEAAIFADDDDDVFDRRCGFDCVDRLVGIGRVCGI